MSIQASSSINLDPVIVVGSPRSGTAVVTRNLQENFGYMMDEGPIRKDWRNPNGYYEDRRLLKINHELFFHHWKYKTKNENRMNRQWAVQFAKFVAMRAFKYEKWGFKDPQLIGIIHWTLQFFRNPIFIWTIRLDEQILKSQVDKFGYHPIVAKRGISSYRKLIEKYLSDRNLYKIDLSEYKTDEKICKELRIILNGR